MAIETYIGVNDVAQQVKKMYVGVNDVARKVKNVYIGVNGVAEQVYASVKPPKIVTWNGGTDAEIIAMVEAADRGEINLAKYWSIGDERTVSLSAMPATGVGESHVAQSIKFVLMDTDKINLNSPTASGRTKSQFVIGMKDALIEPGYMNSGDDEYFRWTTDPAYLCARRPWCNNVFYAAIPQPFRSIFKLFKSPYHDTVDRFSLFAEKEIQGTNTKSTYDEAKVETHIEYYKTASNRRKVSPSDIYWLRSKFASSWGSCNFCVTDYGSSASAPQYYAYGISPFGVI